jgi:hypothetical protein
MGRVVTEERDRENVPDFTGIFGNVFRIIPEFFGKFSGFSRFFPEIFNVFFPDFKSMESGGLRKPSVQSFSESFSNQMVLRIKKIFRDSSFA